MRQSNIELLRIISILLVCILHANFSALDVPAISRESSSLFVDFVRLEYESIALVAVNVFILISGYFSIKINSQRIIGLCFTIFFWNILLSLAAVCLGWISLSQGFKLLIPGLNDWFVQCYLLLVLVSPLCNYFVGSISVADLKKYILVFLVLEFLFGWLVFWGYAFYGGYSLLHFIGIYLIGRYMELSKFKINISIGKAILNFVILMSGPAVVLFVVLYFLEIENIRVFLIQRFTAYSSPFNILGAVFLLLIFKKITLRSKIINNLSTAVFSVYLIHTFPIVFDWYKKLSYELFLLNSVLWIAIMPLLVCLVFIMGYLLDRTRVYASKILVKRLKYNTILPKLLLGGYD